MASDVITFRMESREFNAAIAEMMRVSGKDAPSTVKSSARNILRNLVRFTPKAAKRQRKGYIDKSGRRLPPREILRHGRARAGWWRSWQALGMPGTPYINNALLRDNEGAIVDNLSDAGNPHVVLVNEVPYIEDLEGEKSILSRGYKLAGEYMEKSLVRQYKRMFKRHHGK